jgi:hypothetical protein
MQHWCRIIGIDTGQGPSAIGFTAFSPKLEALVFDLPNVVVSVDKNRLFLTINNLNCRVG